MKQDLRVTVTKRIIHEALLKLLEKKAIDKIKINELCELSGVNRSTFYRHYENLQDVLGEIQGELIRNIPRPEGPPRNWDEVHAKIDAMCNYMYKHGSVLKVLFANYTDDDMTQSLVILYTELLGRHQEELPVSGHDEDARQILITLVSGASYSLLKNWIMGRIQKTPEELADIIFNIIRLQGPFCGTGDFAPTSRSGNE